MFSGDVSSRRSFLQRRLRPSLAVVGTRVQWSHDDLSYSRKSLENNTSNTAATRGKMAILNSRTFQRSVSSLAKQGTSIATCVPNDQVRRKPSSELASVGVEKQSIHCVSRPTKSLVHSRETSTRLVLHDMLNTTEPRIAWGEDSNKLKRSEKRKTTQNKAKHNEGDDSVKPSPRIKSNHPPSRFSVKLPRTAAFKLKKLLKSASLTETEKRLLIHQFRSMGQTLATPVVGFPEDGASDSVDEEEKDIEDSLVPTEADVEEESPQHIMKYVDTSSNSLKDQITLLFEEQKPLNARELVDQAIKNKKVFMIAGGHSPVRTILRKRGWVEKFYNIPTISKKPGSAKHHKHSDEIIDFLAEDSDADLHDNSCNNDEYDKLKIEPWREDGGVYGEMSQMLRNATPSLVWVQKRDIFDYRCLTKDQMVNHYSKAGSFTTKAGLCVNLKNVMWYDDLDPDSFFPRCYLLSKDDEKNAFIDDFRLTACMNIIKIAVIQLDSNVLLEDRESEDSPKSNLHISQHCTITIVDTSITDNTAIADTSVTDNKALIMDMPVTDQTVIKDISVTDHTGKHSSNTLLPSTTSPLQQKEEHELKDEPPLEGTESKQKLTAVTHTPPKQKKKEQPLVPVYVLERALKQCEKFLAFKTHQDLDTPIDANTLTEKDWDDLLHWSYLLVQEEGTFDQVPVQLHMQCDGALQRLTALYPQLEMSGIRNVWIVKPGAKSRGRGIRCYEQLKDMLKLVSSPVAKTDGKYVVQKYIEKPLLLYNTKFDIRQWFLVTDWNPLTVWFYSDSYLRFCSQQFTLQDFSESIHLSNNAIQKNYKNGPRSRLLPAENMWSSTQFKQYLEHNQRGEVWDQKIYPLMKRIIIAALLANQELVESRKSGFELYGADFMLTEDFSPWLLEINSSPSMEPSTSVTTQLCKAVLEDVIKVVVDRKLNKNCDTGRFELAYKQPFTATPPYIGTNLCVEGRRVKKPGSLSNRPQPIADLAVGTKGVSKMAGACKRCGNRGNLRLDTTDPECPCQKDSCVFSLHFDRTFPEAQNQINVKYPQSLRKMQYPSNKSPGSKKQKACYTVPAYPQDLTDNKGLVGAPPKMTDFACVRPASAHCIGTYARASTKQHKSRKSGSAHHNKLLSESDGLPPPKPPQQQQEPHYQTGSVLGNLTTLQQLRTYSSLGSLYNHTSSLVRSFSSRMLTSRPAIKTDLR